MNIQLKLFLVISLCSTFVVQAQQKNATTVNPTAEHNAWLKDTFSEQHQQLIPIVAVADMLFACNQKRQIEPVTYKLDDLILTMDKNRLAEKLSACLKEDNIQSEVALNFGLEGCFHEQLAHLPQVEQQHERLIWEVL